MHKELIVRNYQYKRKSLIYDKKSDESIRFTANFGSEASCRLHFKEERDETEFNVNVEAKNILDKKLLGLKR